MQRQCAPDNGGRGQRPHIGNDGIGLVTTQVSSQCSWDLPHPAPGKIVDRELLLRFRQKIALHPHEGKLNKAADPGKLTGKMNHHPFRPAAAKIGEQDGQYARFHRDNTRAFNCLKKKNADAPKLRASAVLACPA